MATVGQSPSLRPIQSPSRTELVAAELRRAIGRGDFSPGSQLVEASLVRELGVSRGTLREAMQRLVQEGLLVTRAHRGVFVSTVSDGDVIEIYGARRALELSAALTLAEAPDADVLSALSDAHDAMQRAVADGDGTALVDADIRFHDLLVASLGNGRLLRVSETYAVELRLCITRLGEQYSLPAEAVAEHLAIIEAIAARRPAAVIRAIDTHMSNAIALLIDDAAAPPVEG